MAAVWVNADRTLAPHRLEKIFRQASAVPDGPGLVVIDDADQLPTASVRYIDERLNKRPESIRLVLLSRWDLGLSRLVPELLGHLTVLRGDVLRMSKAETARLVADYARTDSQEVVDAIASRADGWCAAIVLAARASGAAPNQSDFARRCLGAGPGVADLVAGEVFAALRPRERHLLLSCAMRSSVTIELARHLTHDDQAGDVLAGLESTGLLVTRVGTGEPGETAQDDDVFRIHPLLREVVRRRWVAGGVDVARARATVLRAARLDLARGQVVEAFKTLVLLREDAEAADVVSLHGPQLVAEGQSGEIVALLRRAAASVEDRPDTWATLAWSHWLRHENAEAEHWAGRLVDREPPNLTVACQVACLRLHRSRFGAEPVEPAAELARTLLDEARAAGDRGGFVTLLLLELGVAENWLGDFEKAEEHLKEAALVSRASGLDGVAIKATTHLALTRFMDGRRASCAELTDGVLSAPWEDPAAFEVTRTRAGVAQGLARAASLPWPDPRGPHDAVTTSPSTADDLTTRFWAKLLGVRTSLLEGRITDAQRWLDRDIDTPTLPGHLRTALLVEQALLGLVTGDSELLRRTAEELDELDAPAERAFVEAARADLDGNLREAVGLHLEAARAGRWRLPGTRAMSLVCAAQLRDYLGEPAEARELMAEAVAATRAERSAEAFLGWSAHGSRVGSLLSSGSASESAWGAELRAACADRASIATMFRGRVGTRRELGATDSPLATCTLSPREHEVLVELARGSTYADIAANFFVSPNTVKTHVSSLYSKLSVGRRSEALAVARKLHLL